MSLSEGSSARLAYKFYSSGAISSNTEPDTATDPGASGAQTLRRVSCSLNMTKDKYQSNEIRTDKQISDSRHGVKRVAGAVSGELSPLTYQDFFQALLRGTLTAGVSKTESDFTSIAATNATSKLTVGGSTWAAQGFKIGDVIRLASASVAANNRNFVIYNLSGVDAFVYPAPTDMSADTAFTVSVPGRKVMPLAGSHVSRKVAVEVYHEDINLARLYTECRVSSGKISMPATGMATVEFGMTGRNMQVLTGSSAPYFTSPTAETSTGITAAVNGVMLMNGAVTGVITSMNINIDLSASADPVQGQNIVPEIFLGRTVVTGDFSAFLADATILDAFTDETEVSFVTFMTTTNAVDSPFIAVNMQRVKIDQASIETSGEGGQMISAQFQALRKATATWYDSTTIVVQDSESA